MFLTLYHTLNNVTKNKFSFKKPEQAVDDIHEDCDEWDYSGRYEWD